MSNEQALKCPQCGIIDLHQWREDCCYWCTVCGVRIPYGQEERHDTNGNLGDEEAGV